MTWEEFGRVRVLSQGTAPQTFPLPVATMRLKATGLNYEISQTGLRKLGWLLILDLDGAIISRYEVFRETQVITIPNWVNLCKLRFDPVAWLVNAELIVYKWIDPPSYDNPVIPIVIPLSDIPIDNGGYN